MFHPGSVADAPSTDLTLKRQCALQSDFSAFSAAARTFVTDSADGGTSASDVSAVQSAAASIQADAQATEANPAPTCEARLTGPAA